MAEQDIRVIITLLYASPAILAALCVCSFLHWLVYRNREDRQRRPGIGGMLLFSACLLGSVWCLRYAVGYYTIVTADKNIQTLSKLEEVFNSVAHALQTFSMDEDYTEYILNGKQMMTLFFGKDSYWPDAYGLYASVLNFIAPVAGGAIIFEILASIFPRLRLLFLYLLAWREKCYFSALTPASLALAKSITEQEYPRFRKPVLIFTDTYVDDEKEKDYELLLSAKQLGAICVRDDLLHVSKNLFGKRSYYLMDENELENLQTLQALAEKAKREHLKKAKIYLFVQSDLYVRMEKQIRKRLRETLRRGRLRYSKPYLYLKEKLDAWIKTKILAPLTEKGETIASVDGRKKPGLLDRLVERLLKHWMIKAEKKKAKQKAEQKNGEKEVNPYTWLAETIKTRREKKAQRIEEREAGKLPVTIPVYSYRNLVHNLLTEVPLYEPLVHKDNKKELNVTIFGNGVIGTEAFFSTYWFGQLLISEPDSAMSLCSLNINVVSKDKEADFWAKIAYTNPEIRKTKEADSDLLLYDGCHRNAPYCRVEYRQADVKSGGFMDLETETSKFLQETDYFIIALGNDADNITVADRLRRGIGKKHLEDRHNNGEAFCVPRTVIAYAVFDSVACKTLNEQQFCSSCQPGVTDIYMHAFGSLEQVYSCDNMLMSKSLLWAEEIGHAYLKPQLDKWHLQDNQKRADDEDRDYSYWADLARAMHVKYKVFSLGWITTSVFDVTDEASCREKHYEQVQKVCARYKRLAITEAPGDDALRKELEAKKHALAWLEHRRWCAFTRSMGYQKCDALEENLALYGKHKNMPLKLHPCLVEAQMPAPLKNAKKNGYILAEFCPNGKVEEDSCFKETDQRRYDCLDRVAYRWRDLVLAQKETVKKKLSFYDFKMYDYYSYEFDDYDSVQQAADKLKCSQRWVRWLCDQGKLTGCVKFDEQEDWLIPERTVKEKMKKWYYKFRPEKKTVKKETVKQA